MSGIVDAPETGRPAREATFWLLVFGATLLDSLLVYFLRTLTGRLWPVNFLVALIAVAGWIAFGMRRSLPHGSAIVGLALCAAGFALGVVFLEEFTAYRAVEMAGGWVTFAVGYAAIRNLRRADDFARVLLWIGGIYVVVCIAALWRVAPAALPIIEAVGMDAGDLVVRPEVTTDQNFQIYYLFLVALPLALPSSIVRTVAALLLSAGAALVLVRLQTRSGALVFGSVLLAGWAALAWQRADGARAAAKHLWLMPCALLALVALQAERIVQIAAPLLRRFTGGDFVTLQGRVDSASYFFEHVLDAAYWFPQGNAEFLRHSGDVPHFNPAAYLLEGGLIALAGWSLVYFLPLLRLATRFLQRRTDPVAILALLGGAVSFVAALSLNAPHFKQAWLWAGAVIGALARAAPAGLQFRKELPQPERGLPKPANLMS